MLVWILTFLKSRLGQYIVLACVIMLSFYKFYSWSAEQGRQECELRVLKESERVRALVHEELKKVVQDANTRAIDAEKKNAELDASVDKIIAEAERDFKDNNICVPSVIVDSLRKLN